MRERRKGPTATSNFGVGKRESHDASGFYSRFAPPELSAYDEVKPPKPVDEPFQCADARRMDAIEDGTVALVVTSPPYFAGKQYEEELEREGVPSSYAEYLDLLHDVFAECKRKLEPGGRIAVNVANLGRKPYRSLSGDVVRILQDDLKLLLRGEVLWRKGEGATGSCAWGSFRSPANPVLRDLTERVVIAGKGRFDRAKSAAERRRLGLPWESTLGADEFMAATLDVWEIAPERARVVGHPAPFPVGLPERLIHLYTYRDDLVLDPFMGSGSTLVAAARTGRRYIGYDLDPQYVAVARERVAAVGAEGDGPASFVGLGVEGVGSGGLLGDVVLDGQGASTLAAQVLESAGFTVVARNKRLRGTGMAVGLVADDARGTPWYFDLSGAFTTTPEGMLRMDNVWRVLGRAHVLANRGVGPLVLLTSHLPRPGSEGDRVLHAAGPGAFFDAIELRASEGFERLRAYAAGGQAERPRPGFWSPREIAPG